MENYKIYTLKDPRTEFVRYVGYTKQDIHKRLLSHLSEKNRTRRKNNWIKSLRSEGVLPIIELIEDKLTFEQAQVKEVNYIALFKAVGADLTNYTNGGGGIRGYKYTDEQKRAHGLRMKGKLAGNKNPMWGKKHSEETRKKIKERLSHIDMSLSEEHINKIRIANKGKKLSEEHKRKIGNAQLGKVIPKHIIARRSKARMGKRISEETRRKIQEANFGKKGTPHTEQTKELLRQINTGKVLSDEHKQKIRITNLRLGRKPPRHFGANHPCAKITSESADEIKRLYCAGNVSQEKLASIFSIGQSTISEIIIGKHWTQKDEFYSQTRATPRR